MLKTTPFMLLTRFEETVPRWEASEAFRATHNPAEDNNPLYLDHPQYEGFEVRQTVGHGKTAEWDECKLQPQFCYGHHDATDTLDWNKSLSSWLGVKNREGPMDQATRCPKCGKRMVPLVTISGRTDLQCISCDDPAVKWAESPVTAPEKPIVLDRV